jgi:hypothetical protein
MSIRILVPAIAIFLAAGSAHAAADLRVTMPTPAAQYAGDASELEVVVANIGNKSAASVVLTVTLPTTHTTPNHPAGPLSNVDSRCTRVGTNLSCALGTINKNTSKTVSFDIALPVATETFSISSSASTPSAENTLANNTAAAAPPQLYYAIPIVSGDIGVELCTGTGLTSFYACTLFPSSLSGFDAELTATGEIVFDDTAYGGQWSQTPPGSSVTDPRYLSLSLTELGTEVATFEGWGADDLAGCFEGVTTFPGSTYVAPYRVCI